MHADAAQVPGCAGRPLHHHSTTNPAAQYASSAAVLIAQTPAKLGTFWGMLSPSTQNSLVTCPLQPAMLPTQQRLQLSNKLTLGTHHCKVRGSLASVPPQMRGCNLWKALPWPRHPGQPDKNSKTVRVRTSPYAWQPT